MGSPEVRIIRLGGKATRSTAETSLWQCSKNLTAHHCTQSGSTVHMLVTCYPWKPNSSAMGSDSKVNHLGKVSPWKLLPVVFLRTMVLSKCI